MSDLQLANDKVLVFITKLSKGLRTSINRSPTEKMMFRGHCGLQTASEVRSDLGFEIYGPNNLCYCYREVPRSCRHRSSIANGLWSTTMFGWTVLTFFGTLKEEEENLARLDLSATPQVKRYKCFYQSRTLRYWFAKGTRILSFVR